MTRYRIVESLGRGGMGEACLAADVVLRRQVALQFLTSPGEPGEHDALDQLLSEARAAAALDHPFICSIDEVTTLNDRPCIAMEYVRGEALERRLRRGPMPVADALRVAEELWDGVVRWVNIECGKEGLSGLGKFPTQEELLAAARTVTAALGA